MACLPAAIDLYNKPPQCTRNKIKNKRGDQYIPWSIDIRNFPVTIMIISGLNPQHDSNHPVGGTLKSEGFCVPEDSGTSTPRTTKGKKGRVSARGTPTPRLLASSCAQRPRAQVARSAPEYHLLLFCRADTARQSAGNADEYEHEKADNGLAWWPMGSMIRLDLN